MNDRISSTISITWFLQVFQSWLVRSQAVSMCIWFTHGKLINHHISCPPCIPAPFLCSFSGSNPVNKFTSANIWAGVHFRENIWDLCRQESHYTVGLETFVAENWVLSTSGARDPWETLSNPYIQSRPRSSPRISDGESYKHNTRSHTTNFSRNCYIVSHRKFICEYCTLLLDNLAVPRLGWIELQGRACLLSGLMEGVLPPSELGRGKRESCMASPSPGTGLRLGRTVLICPMLTLWAAMWLHPLTGWFRVSYLLSFTKWCVTKCHRQFHPSKIFSLSHTESCFLAYTSWSYWTCTNVCQLRLWPSNLWKIHVYIWISVIKLLGGSPVCRVNMQGSP